MSLAPRLFALVIVSLGLLAGVAGANPNPESRKMDVVFTSPNMATNSDLAFWGKHAFVGYYTGATGFPPGSGPRGGVRIFDISDPAAPRLVRDFACDGAQNDPILWDRNRNGVADLMLLAVDTTMAGPQCGAARVAGGTPNGWEGVRVFTLSDDPANPFTSIQQVKSVYTDCGAHTITLWPEEPGKLLVYVSSLPARGRTHVRRHGVPEHRQPVRRGSGQPRQSAARGDPDRGGAAGESGGGPGAGRAARDQLSGRPGRPTGVVRERAVRADARARCRRLPRHRRPRRASPRGSGVRRAGPGLAIGANGIPDTQNPISIGDDKVSSGGTGQFPGAVDFFHSVMFNNEGTVVNWVDESFGGGCPTMTTNNPRPHAAKALEAMRRAFDRPWADGEPLMMSNLLRSLGHISRKDIAEEQLRELRGLHAGAKPNTTERLHMANNLAVVLGHQGRQKEGVVLLGKALTSTSRRGAGSSSPRPAARPRRWCQCTRH